MSARCVGCGDPLDTVDYPACVPDWLRVAVWYSTNAVDVDCSGQDCDETVTGYHQTAAAA